MVKKWKLSKCKAVITDDYGYVLGMSSIVVEPKRKRRIGHARYMYMSQFDYDTFLKKGYSIDKDGHYVFKLDKNVSDMVTRVFGDSGFRKFVSSVLLRTAWGDARDRNSGQIPDEIMRLFSTIMQESTLELDRIQSEANSHAGGIAALLAFKLSY